jgi:hypothetical protein
MEEELGTLDISALPELKEHFFEFIGSSEVFIDAKQLFQFFFGFGAKTIGSFE